MLASISDLPFVAMVYDKEWDRPLIHRLSSVRKHVLTALDKAIVLSTQDTVTTRKQQVGCKKYVQIRSVLDIGKAFLSNLAVCTGNNFGVKPKEKLPCRFGLTFSDLTTALNIQKIARCEIKAMLQVHKQKKLPSTLSSKRT